MQWVVHRPGVAAEWGGMQRACLAMLPHLLAVPRPGACCSRAPRFRQAKPASSHAVRGEFTRGGNPSRSALARAAGTLSLPTPLRHRDAPPPSSHAPSRPSSHAVGGEVDQQVAPVAGQRDGDEGLRLGYVGLCGCVFCSGAKGARLWSGQTRASVQCWQPLAAAPLTMLPCPVPTHAPQGSRGSAKRTCVCLQVVHPNLALARGGLGWSRGGGDGQAAEKKRR